MKIGDRIIILEKYSIPHSRAFLFPGDIGTIQNMHTSEDEIQIGKISVKWDFSNINGVISENIPFFIYSKQVKHLCFTPM